MKFIFQKENAFKVVGATLDKVHNKIAGFDYFVLFIVCE